MQLSPVTGAIPGLDSPLGVIGDLPTHTLVVHYAVVMLPLAALALVAIILVPRWRGAFVWAAMVGLVIGTGAAFLSKESGEQLAERIGEPQQHAQWGDVLPWVAVLLLVVAGAWLWLERRSAARSEESGARSGGAGQRVLAAIAIVLAVVVTAMTVVVGHTGAAAVWESRNLNGTSVDAEAQGADGESESEDDETDDAAPAATAVFRAVCVERPVIECRAVPIGPRRHHARGGRGACFCDRLLVGGRGDCV